MPGSLGSDDFKCRVGNSKIDEVTMVLIKEALSKETVRVILAKMHDVCTHSQGLDEMLSLRPVICEQCCGLIGQDTDGLDCGTRLFRVRCKSASNSRNHSFRVPWHLGIGEQQSHRPRPGTRVAVSLVPWIAGQGKTHPCKVAMPPFLPFIALAKVTAPPRTETALSIPLGLP